MPVIHMPETTATPTPASDAAVLAELGERLARARLSRDMTQQDLAREAGVSRATVQRLEAGQSTQLTNLIRVLRTLHLLQRFAGLLAETPVRPLQRLRRDTPRRRASGQPRPTDDDTAHPAPWSWGTEHPDDDTPPDDDSKADRR